MKTKTPPAKTLSSLHQTWLADLHTHPDYQIFLKSIKDKIRTTQVRVALAANLELIQFYWELGTLMIRQQQQTKWGGEVVKCPC